MGGIKVASIEDFKMGNKIVKSGEMLTLKGSNAVAYIQSRDSDVNANNRRMLRQKQFLTSLISKAGNDVLSNFSKLSEYYNLLKPYTATDLSFSQLTYLASNCLSKDLGNSIEFKMPSGTTEFGENGWAEFTPDSDNMLDIIMSVFYTEKKN
jgi:anionic cell wall polymer biosynthesis LytR-Cps2A-Psr (LCP) family protein